MGIQEEIARVRKLFSRWVAEIEANNAEDFFDINKVGEDITQQLLNQIYNYKLQNLNDIKKKFPAVDLGDLEKGIAYQVTSRMDADKIRTSLKKFVDNDLHKYFPQGMRFFLITSRKKSWTDKQKKEFSRLVNDFDANTHIINCTDLLERIKKIYLEDEKRFQSIKDILEREFSEKKEREIPLTERLLKGSLKYHENLTGPTGRFKHLQIADHILSRPEHKKKETWMRQGVMREEEKKSKETVIQLVPWLWDKSYKHTVIVGEGGMGKTVSLIRVWETLLEGCSKRQKGPIPVFIPLNEYNRLQERKDFIVSMIINHYLEEAVSKAEVRKMLRAPQVIKEGTIPSVVLLLDGFNEINVDQQELLNEMKVLIEECRGVQLVLTSRFDMRSLYHWEDFNLLQLQKLEDNQIKTYLEKKNITCPEEGRLKELVSNPMMLTFYAAACDVVEKHRESKEYDFKREVETTGELLWNFMEAQLAILPDRLAKTQKETIRYRFLLKFLLPFLGYEMEKAGFFSFSRRQLNGYVDEYCCRFDRDDFPDDFFDAFPEYESIEESMTLGKLDTGKAKRNRQLYLREILVEKLGMLVEDDEAYGFQHEYFRDYFAAVHVLNELAIGAKKKVVPVLLREGTLSFFVRRIMGEIQGEHRLHPYLVEGEGWRINENEESLLVKALELCRGDFSGDMGVAVWNIVETWKEVRGELSGADLSRLDLSKVNFNSIVCSRSYEDKYISAQFNESLLHATNLFPQGHKGSIYSAVYDNDCNKILSASHDQTIKEWDIDTGKCLRTLKGHTDAVYSAVYSPDGKKILSASYDQTIKEWDAATGKCLRTLKGHTGTVNDAVYSPKGEKILSSSFDGTIKEWDAATGKCLRTLKGHRNTVYSVVYSGDEKKILSASWDKTIKEWDATTGKCLLTIEGHTGAVDSAVYSPKGKKILSASWDNTIKEWDAYTGQCTKTLKGQASDVTNAVYSRDGKKILSASYDQTIKEWDAAMGKCVRTLKGHTDRVRKAVYSRDGEKIYSASDDGKIFKWDNQSGEYLGDYEGNSSMLPSTKKIQQGTNQLEISGNEIIIKNESTDEVIKTLINTPGLWIQGCSFAKLHPNCQFSAEELKHLEMYGAAIAEIEQVDGRT